MVGGTRVLRKKKMKNDGKGFGVGLETGCATTGVGRKGTPPVEAEDVRLGTDNGASSADRSKASCSRVPTEKECVGRPMVERHLTPRECRKQRKLAGTCVVASRRTCRS